MSDQISARTKGSVTKANVYEWTEQNGYQEALGNVMFKLNGQYIVFSSEGLYTVRYYNMDKMMSFEIVGTKLYCYFR
jgi:hypothetical protein